MEELTSQHLSPTQGEYLQHFSEHKEKTPQGEVIMRTYPLSFMQQRLWFLDQLAPGMPTYNIPFALHLKGSLDVAVLEQVLNQIVERHDILRTSFGIIDGQPVQIIAPSVALALPFVDLQELPESERDTQLRVLLTQEAHRSFDLTRDVLLRVVLFRLDPTTHVLLLTIHHIIFDGWSRAIFFHELTVLYEALSAGKPSPLPPLPRQYAEYTLWQRQWLSDGVLQVLLTYWKRQLDGVQPLLNLPTDHVRPAVQSFRGARHLFRLSRELTADLNTLSLREGATLFMTLLATFQILLYRHTGQDDLCVGTPIAGRMQGGVEELIGFFVNTLVIRTRLSGNLSFREVLGQVRTTALEAYTHQDLPFERLVEEMQPERNLSQNPLTQIFFVLQNAPLWNTTLSDLELTFLEVERLTAKLDLTLEMQETTDGLCGSFEYSTDLFEASTIDRMCKHFQVLLEGITSTPDRCLHELPLLTESEQWQLLVEWNNTGTQYPREHCIHQIVESQAKRTPDAVAVICGNDYLTYAQLNQRANQVAHYLCSLGVGPEVLVGLCMERSIMMIVGILAVLKAGGAYVPLDPAYPEERLAFMLEDAGTRVLLTQQQLVTKLAALHVQIVCLDAQNSVIAEQDSGLLFPAITSENLAYVMYTSGSTGKPKGVCITHQNVIRLVKGTNYVELSEKEVFLQFAPISFDASTFEIWACLLNGARLVVPPPRMFSLEELGQFIQRYQVTTLWLTAGLFHQMVENHLEDLMHVQQLLAGGDILSPTYVQRASQAGCRIINGYGPTEGTTFTCCYSIPPGSVLSSSVPIGRPISHTQMYLLDPRLHPVPIGVTGEIYIGGDGLARGYLNRPELTAERFIPNPFSTEVGQRLYRTGDLARYLPDGAIEFLGRNDNQIKLRGFRIETGEIEAALSRHPAVGEATVVVREDTPGNRYLVAYIVPKAGETCSGSELHDFLKALLPAYMLPAAIVLVDEFPLTPNGKVDRKALHIVGGSQLEEKVCFVAPRNALEAQIAEIFEDVVGKSPIGVIDNFFALGGHSLSAMRLLSRLQSKFGQSISLSDFFQEATVECIANVLHERNDIPYYFPLVKMQPHGSKPPFFCVHPADGNIFCYVDLARYLEPDQPFYAFEESFLVEKWDRAVTVEDMAARYIEVLCEVQPQGPYLLGGYSLGGSIAFEMANRLHEQGHKVALLALLDTFAPFPIEEPAEADDEIITTNFIRYVASLRPNISDAQAHRWAQIYRNHLRAAESYQPDRVYPGKITLFRAEEAAEGIPRDPDETLGWRRFSSRPVDVYPISGNHHTLYKEPHVRVLAERLRNCLDQLPSLRPKPPPFHSSARARPGGASAGADENPGTRPAPWDVPVAGAPAASPSLSA